MKVIHIDAETTGTDPAKNGIIQLAGFIEINNKQEHKFDWNIKPFKADIIDEHALKINNTTVEELENYTPSQEAYLLFKSMLNCYVDKFDRTDKFYWIGYNSRFDMDFAREWFRKSGDNYFGSWFYFPPIDVMNLAALDLMKKNIRLNDMKLGTVAAHYGIEAPPGMELHDAFTDIMITKSLFEHLSLI